LREADAVAMWVLYWAYLILGVFVLIWLMMWLVLEVVS